MTLGAVDRAKVSAKRMPRDLRVGAGTSGEQGPLFAQSGRR